MLEVRSASVTPDAQYFIALGARHGPDNNRKYASNKQASAGHLSSDAE